MVKSEVPFFPRRLLDCGPPLNRGPTAQEGLPIFSRVCRWPCRTLCTVFAIGTPTVSHAFSHHKVTEAAPPFPQTEMSFVRALTLLVTVWPIFFGRSLGVQSTHSIGCNGRSERQRCKGCAKVQRCATLRTVGFSHRQGVCSTVFYLQTADGHTHPPLFRHEVSQLQGQQNRELMMGLV